MNQTSKMQIKYAQNQTQAESQLLYFDRMQGEQNQPPSKYNIKGTGETDKKMNCQIGAKLKDMESTFCTEIRNLKQHNQYLLDTIKKLKMKNREQKSLINSQSAEIEKITQQKDVYKEKFLKLQYKIASTQAPTDPKHSNILKIEPSSRVESQYFQSTFACDANHQIHHDASIEYQLKQNVKDNIKRAEENLKQLHEKQQQLMKQYHDNPGVEMRKKCVEISKQIKKMEAQMNKNKNEQPTTNRQRNREQRYQSRSVSKQSRPTCKESARVRSQCKYKN